MSHQEAPLTEADTRFSAVCFADSSEPLTARRLEDAERRPAGRESGQKS